jgi:hypothetical protein
MPVTETTTAARGKTPPHRARSQLMQNAAALLPSLQAGELIPEPDFAKLTGWSIPTLRTWRCLRKGPPHITVGRKVWYRRSSYEKWLLEHERGSERARRRVTPSKY